MSKENYYYQHLTVVGLRYIQLENSHTGQISPTLYRKKNLSIYRLPIPIKNAISSS